MLKVSQLSLSVGAPDSRTVQDGIEQAALRPHHNARRKQGLNKLKSDVSFKLKNFGIPFTSLYIYLTVKRLLFTLYCILLECIITQRPKKF